MNKEKIILMLMFLFVGVNISYGQEHFSRGLEQKTFVPKGQWIAGFNANFTQSSQNNYQFLVIENISGDTYSFKVTPSVCYIFKDNLGVGGKLGYTRSLTKLDETKVIIDSSTDFSLENFYCLSQKYSGMAIFRNYISLGNSKRFGLFNEVQLVCV